MALTGDKARLRVGEPIAVGQHPVATNTTIYQGSLIMANAGGYATVGAAATGQFALGVATKKVVNNPGANGAEKVPYEVGDFEFNSGTAGDALTIANVGDQVFIIDDDVVGATNGGATRSVAGILIGLSAAGKPIVRVGLGLQS